ncbi:metal-dependent hydrolase [Peptostreptococcus equinus]|uniref:metal-dependent hydrolase n=1 Tax=Peptostreptococcus equinus TaxID=3003601 RepID=UPI003BF61C6B
MRGKSHLIIGTLSSLEIYLLLSPKIQLNTSTAICLGSAIFFSTFPDIDEANSNVLNKIVNKAKVKNLHKIITYILLILIFYLYSKTDNSLYIGIGFSIFIVGIINKKFTANFLRSFLMFIFLFILSISIYLISKNLPISLLVLVFSLLPLFSHRTLSHSLFIVILLFLALKYVEITFSIYGLSIMATSAYISHLICDSMTKMGIPLFFPISKKNYNISKLRVGTFLCNSVENIIIFILILIVLLTLSFLI